MNVEQILLIALSIYLIVMFAISLNAKSKVNTVEDFVVAGRRLPLWMASATLIATWFGAGPVLTASTEVANHGLHKAALDPIGAGLCLIIAGLFYASKLWKMGILTVCDFFKKQYGSRAETISAFILVPSYFGWIAAQFVALANLLNYLFDIPVFYAITLIAIIGTVYTAIGGMWSVTLTDTIQMGLVILGLVALAVQVAISSGSGDLLSGVGRIYSDLNLKNPAMLECFHKPNDGGFYMWFSIVLAGALGNIPGQDLMQRIFASRSESTAKHACILSGIIYLLLGAITVGLGLSASILIPEKTITSALPALASAFLSPLPMTLFLLAIVSAVLSTIDSAILAPATVLAQNLIQKIPQNRLSQLTINRLSIIFIATMSYCLAISGEGAYGLLEDAYSLTMVGLFIPLTLGLTLNQRSEKACIGAMVCGALVWSIHSINQWQFFLEPVDTVSELRLNPALVATLMALAVYFAIAKRDNRKASTNQ